MVRRVRAKRVTGGRRGRSVVAPGILKPSTKRSALLGSTALVAGVLAGLGAMVSMPRPAMADAPSGCANMNWADFGTYGFYSIACNGNVNGQVSYDGGAAPFDASDANFDGDLHLTTASTDPAGTFIHSPWDGIDINDDSNGYNIEVYVDNQTAILSQTEVVQVTTSEGGTINIENHGFLSNSEGGYGPQNGIDARSYFGDITIYNYGIVGVNFISGLDFSGGNFIDTESEGDIVTLTDGSAFNIPMAAADGITGNGISAVSEDVSEGDNIGNIEVNNLGTVWAAEDGIYTSTNARYGTTTIRNLSTSSIHSGGDGISASGAGGTIEIYNGDGSGNTAPIPDNADGVIESGASGIVATNLNAGDIFIYNGQQSPSNSMIVANGDYGIYAITGGAGGSGYLFIGNEGVAQAQGGTSDAVVWGQTTDGSSGSYAQFYNGFLNKSARLNAYGFDDNTSGGGSPTVDGSDPFGIVDSFDANGIELRKLGGTGGANVADYSLDGPAGEYGVFMRNDGVWDFGGTDNYLTPGFSDANTAVDEGTGASTTGGVYAPGGSAVLIRNYSDSMTGIWNWGTMIGEGSRYDPVLDIKTSEGDSGAGTFLYNGMEGLIGSAATPYNWGQYGLTGGLSDLVSVLQGPGYGFWDDVEALIGNGGVAAFGEAAGDHLMTAEGAPSIIYNDGVLIGRLDLRSQSESGNYFANQGVWLVTGDNKFYGGPNDELFNGPPGLIQTAFDPNSDEWTNLKGLNSLTNLGVLSMVDTSVGSMNGVFDSLETSGDYTGGDGYTPGSRGYLAVDTYFGPVDGEGGVGSDKFLIDGEANGSTGVIVHKLNETPGFIDPTTDGIKVADIYYDANTNSTCYDTGAWCRDGDTFYVDERSQSYIKVDGVGFIADGFFMHGLKEIGTNEEDPGVYFQSTYSPNSVNQPALTTGAQNAFYSNGGVVDDHQYGNDYPQSGQGGGGADLPYASPDAHYAAAAPAGHRSALWGRMTGTWANQDSSFTTGGLTFDTSFAQHDYGLLAGIEMRPPTDNSGWRLGLYGGWTSSGLTFSSYGASANYNGGTVGAYAAYVDGPLHLDAEFKADFLGVDYRSPTVSASTNATNLGILTNAAWRTQKGNLYYEPIVSFDFVNTSLGNASGGGATISYSDGQSIRAGIGGRIGTSIGQPGGKKVDLDLMAKLWNEFGSPNTVTVSQGGNTQSFTELDQRVVRRADRPGDGLQCRPHVVRLRRGQRQAQLQGDLGHRQGWCPPQLLRRPGKYPRTGRSAMAAPFAFGGTGGLCVRQPARHTCARGGPNLV